MKAMSSIHAILHTRSQCLAGKRYHRCTLHTLVHSSPAALTATAPWFFVGQRYLLDIGFFQISVAFQFQGRQRSFPVRCLPLAQ